MILQHNIWYKVFGDKASQNGCAKCDKIVLGALHDTWRISVTATFKGINFRKSLGMFSDSL